MEIGARAQIGANAVVVRDVPPDSVVVGVPGEVRKPTPDDATSPVRFNPDELDAIDPAIWI